MTKIKNTKKGMAKKTLSMSLVVAMLATSNVPVWAAEFSDGSDASVAVETPATETFSDEAAETPVAENEEAVSAEATTNNKFNATVEFKKNGSKFTDKSVTWNVTTLTANVKVSAGEEKTADNVYAVWMADGKQIKANSENLKIGTAKSLAPVKLDSKMADAGSKITLYIYAVKDNETVWSYTSDPISVEKIDINDVVDINDMAKDVTIYDSVYDGKKHTVTKSDVVVGGLLTDWNADDFTIGDVVGDTENVTDDGVTVTLVPTKSGYTGVLTRKYHIIPKKLSTNNATGNVDTDIQKYIKAEVVNTTTPYTGTAISPKTTDVKLIDKKTGADLSGYIDSVAALTPNESQAGVSTALKITLKGSSDGTIGNYNITAPDKVITTENKLTVTQKSLKDIDIKIPEIKDKKPYTITGVRYFDKATGEELTIAPSEINIDTTSITGTGTFTLKVSPASKNFVDETTATVRVTDSSLNGATFANDYATAAEEYTGEQIVKDISKLGAVYLADGTKLNSANYRIEFGKNIDAGKGVIRIVGQNSYANSVAEVYFPINKAAVTKDTITYNEVVEKKDTATPSAYKDAIGLVVKAKNAKGKEFTLVEGTDYTVK